MIDKHAIQPVLSLRHVGFVNAFVRPKFPRQGGLDAQVKPPSGCSRGFTLLELMLALAILALMAAIAVPLYIQQIDKAKVARAVADIGGMQVTIDRYDLTVGSAPQTLVEAGVSNVLDPWGNPYQYLNLGNCKKDKCLDANNETVKARRDGNLKPINTYFDLYSMGKDGESKQSLVANESQDDIVRAMDGAFIGLASDYSPK